MPLLILFILIPIIEIGLFVQVGGVIGLWPTLAIVILTAIIGTTMLRNQGISTMARLQSSLQTGESPVDPIVHGALILVSGSAAASCLATSFAASRVALPLT